MTTAEPFDFIVVGGGSGGVAAARRAAGHGARTVLLEPARLGGTCVNVGCVPKKIMWSAAELASAIRDAPGYGFDVAPVEVDWARLKRGRDEYVAMLNGVYERNLLKEGVTIVRERGRFVDPRTVEAGGRRFTAPHVLVATGGRPRVPTVPGAELGITSDGFFSLEARPRSIVVVGAGYVALELGGVFRGLGTDVTLAMRHDEPLRGFDGTIRAAAREHLEEAGIRVVRDFDVAAVERSGPSLVVVGTAGVRLGPADVVVWATGREPVTSDLGLEVVPLARDLEGHIVVDDFQNTSVGGVYAVGDVTGRAALTPVAIAAGRRLGDRLFGGEPEARLDYDGIPTVVFAHPPIGTVGLGEEAARALHGSAVKVYVRRFSNLFHGLAVKKQRTTVKLVVAGPDERVLGVHVAGLGADEMMQGFAVALRMGATKADFDRTVAIHPTAAEEVVTLR